MPPEPAPGPFIFKDAAQGASEFVGREWVLDEIGDWMDHGTERFFLLVGEPGWGKSSLSAWMLGTEADKEPASEAARERLARFREAWSAAHLCSASTTSTVNPTTFCRSIARQLAHRFDDFAAAFLERVAPGQYNIAITTRDVIGRVVALQTEQLIVEAPDARDAWEQSVRLPLADVAAKDPAGGPIYILVDGLDDALTFTPPHIVDLLAGSRDFPERVRFFLTSRVEPRILEAFPAGDDVRMVTVSDPARQADNDRDIRTYVEGRLADPSVRAWADSAGLEPEAFVDDLVGHADGNFLFIRFVLATRPPVSDVVGPAPPGLHAMYANFLRRVLPGVVQFGEDPTWSGAVKPVFGALTVAAPAAPVDSLPRWLGASEPVQRAVGTVGQMIEWIDDGGSCRLYHRSLGDFLSMAMLPPVAGPPQPNRFFVEPRGHHEAISRYYLDAIDTDWASDWTQCDTYGLRRLVPHLRALHALTESRSERAAIAERLCRVALDDGFQAAQRERLGDASATIEAIRLALDVCTETGDPEAIRERARKVAESWEPAMRASAARALAELSRTDPKAALDELKALVR